MAIFQGNTGLDCSVLVLNKHYLAVRIVGVRKAFSLLLRDMAEVIACDEGYYANHNFQSCCELSHLSRRSPVEC